MIFSGLLCPHSLSLATCHREVWASLGETTVDDPHLSGLICKKGGGADHGQTMLLLVVAELCLHQWFTPQQNHTSPRWQWATCRTVCHSARREECQSDWNWKRRIKNIKMFDRWFLNLCENSLNMGKPVGSALSRFNSKLPLCVKGRHCVAWPDNILMLTVFSPSVGFGQVVGAGINLVDGKEPWASSTCR